MKIDFILGCFTSLKNNNGNERTDGRIFEIAVGEGVRCILDCEIALGVVVFAREKLGVYSVAQEASDDARIIYFYDFGIIL